MGYCQIYSINREIHTKPLVDVVMTVARLHKEYDGLDVLLKEPQTDREIECRVMDLLMEESIHIGGKIKIITRGNYSLETLKECADEIGKIFSFRGTSPSLWETLYKREYGYYPDEEPVEK